MRQCTDVLDQLRKVLTLHIVLVSIIEGQPPIGTNWKFLTKYLKQQQQQSNYEVPISSPENWVFI